MCGIIGFNWNDKNLLKKSSEKIKHRGPDSSGFYTDDEVSLGHRRLSIVDLSSRGKQPMSNENEDIFIIFNGEIYNHKELRKNLEKKHQFKSETDTEVLIHLYEEYGFDFVEKLQGMFAFCIYDSVKKIFFIARDRAGIKPLYYTEYGDKFVFCSEIKGIIENKDVRRKVNREALQSFLIFRANILEETMFSGIKKLLPGHWIVYDLEKNKIRIKKYWDVSFQKEFKSFKDYSKILRNLLEDSVKSRLMSDVPFGAYLSGGIDSGTIVSLMGKFSDKPVETFSVGFADEKESELAGARILAENLETNHHELVIDKNSVKNLPDIVYHADEPMSDPTSIPIYMLSKYAKKYCTVILTGEGADEIFEGYPQYKFMKIHEKFIRPMPKKTREFLLFSIKNSPNLLKDKLFKYSSALGEKGIERFENFVMSDKEDEQYLNQIAIFNKKEQEELLNDKVEFKELSKKYFSPNKNLSSAEKSQFLDFKGPMVDDLLMKLDKNTMAFGIEGRVPFLDYRIIELANKMPENYKLKNILFDKFILRRVTKNLIPDETRKRKKRHFFVPIDKWFKDELLGLKDELLAENYIKKQGIFKNEYIDKINKNFKSSPLFYSRQMWSLMVFQIWHKIYIENEKIRI